jgi:hypothetical protein
MVSWQTFVEIGFDVAESKGATFTGISDGGAFMSDLAEVWSRDKERYIQMTEQQVRNELRDMVSA